MSRNGLRSHGSFSGSPRPGDHVRLVHYRRAGDGGALSRDHFAAQCGPAIAKGFPLTLRPTPAQTLANWSEPYTGTVLGDRGDGELGSPPRGLISGDSVNSPVHPDYPPEPQTNKTQNRCPGDRVSPGPVLISQLGATLAAGRSCSLRAGAPIANAEIAVDYQRLRFWSWSAEQSRAARSSRRTTSG